ncbi:hypothetical protein AAW51_0176 [Caldimonas brevitalea]|uniref:DUF306 domain-containing protein n=1 Tax=Caldimonas brevitalea TaxID=413882 RepID=A0A0G3BC31_9BURK|nr:hypothetical protein AAW51_0176 [Caldimonas brevitalea]
MAWLPLVILMPACGPDLSKVGQDKASDPVTIKALSTLTDRKWRLERFQAGDGTTLASTDTLIYTVRFAPEGRYVVRFDCNQGTGTWKSPRPNALQFEEFILTSALCKEPGLHDRLVRDWSLIRSFRVDGDHLLLSLDADAGVYEFREEPR